MVHHISIIGLLIQSLIFILDFLERIDDDVKQLLDTFIDGKLMHFLHQYPLLQIPLTSPDVVYNLKGQLPQLLQLVLLL